MNGKSKTGYPDRALINASENYEIEYWSNKFGVTPERLKSAIRAVGNSVNAVKDYLK